MERLLSAKEEGRVGRMGIWRSIGCNCSSVPGFVSAPGSDSAFPHSSDTGSLGIWTLGSEREVVVNMLNSLSRNRTLPQIVPRCGCVDPLPGRLPYRGYESPCSGRHYCLRGMDYCTTGEPSTERRLRPLCSQQPTVRFAGIRPPCPGSTHKRAPPPRVPLCSAARTHSTSL